MATDKNTMNEKEIKTEELILRTLFFILKKNGFWKPGSLTEGHFLYNEITKRLGIEMLNQK